MPVDGTQPVYPPQTLTPITSAWGRAVSDAVIQKFASSTDLTNKWPNPPAGSMAVVPSTSRLYIHNGTQWIIHFEPPQPWAPAGGGDFAPGSGGVASGWFQRANNQIEFWGGVTLGTGFAIYANPRIALPIQCYAGNVVSAFLDVNYFSAGSGWNTGAGWYGESISFTMSCRTSFTKMAAISPTFPQTWKAGDAMQFAGRYRMLDVHAGGTVRENLDDVPQPTISPSFIQNTS